MWFVALWRADGSWSVMWCAGEEAALEWAVVAAARGVWREVIVGKEVV